MYLFWLHWVLVGTHGICSLLCDILSPRAAPVMQFPDRGLNLGPPALGMRRLSYWITREVSPLYS